MYGYIPSYLNGLIMYEIHMMNYTYVYKYVYTCTLMHTHTNAYARIYTHLLANVQPPSQTRTNNYTTMIAI